MHKNQSVVGIEVVEQARSYDTVRKVSPSLFERAKTELLKAIFPGRAGVRGDWIAVDYLLEAILRFGTADRYHVFTHPHFLQTATALIASYEPQKLHSGRIRICSRLNLSESSEDHDLSVFFAPQGLSVTPFRIRTFYRAMYPVALLSHGFSSHYMLFDAFARILLSPTYSCDSVICTSRASRAAITRIFETLTERFDREFRARLEYLGRFDVIPLGVDTDKFRPAPKNSLRKRFGLPHDAVVLSYLGRISSAKAELLPLLRIFGSLLNTNPARKLRLVIAGTRDLPYAQLLEDQARNLSVAPHVHFVFDLTDEQKLCLLQSSDIFISPADSLEESFGIAPVEAMACGIPQIVSDWNGYRDTVSHGETGFLVPTHWTRADSDLAMTGALLGLEFDKTVLGGSVAVDVRSLHSHLKELIENPQLRENMSRCSVQRARARFSFPSIVKQYEDLWTELSRMAQTLNLRATRNMIDCPSYFDCFQAHPTFVIGEDQTVTLTAFGCEISDSELLLLLKALNIRFKILDERLIRVAISYLRNGSAGATFGSLTQVLERQCNRNPDFARRHIMWLLKHGLVST